MFLFFNYFLDWKTRRFVLLNFVELQMYLFVAQRWNHIDLLNLFFFQNIHILRKKNPPKHFRHSVIGILNIVEFIIF